MTPKLAVAAVEMLLEKHAPHLIQQGWMVDIDQFKKRCGLCSYNRKTIYLSEPFILTNPIKEIERTGLHEIAHALVGPGHGHDQVWKLKAMSIGLTNPTTCNWTAKMSAGPWMAVCHGCTRIYYKHRRPKHLKGWCGTCGRVKGDLTWTPNENYVNLDKVLKSI